MNSNWVMQEKHLTLFAGIIFLVSATGSAIAQEPTKPLKERIVGTWDLVSNYAARQDGSRLDAFGPNPTGRYMLDATGRFSYMIYGSGRPRFASNNRREGTLRKTRRQYKG